MLVLVGIPHGAVDHLIHWKSKNASLKQKRRFYFQYIGLIIVFAIAWIVSPTSALTIFLLISAFHFGQSQLFYLDLPVWFRFVVFAAWGMLVLSIITYFNYEECLHIFNSLSLIEAGQWLSDSVLLGLIAVSVILFCSGLIMNRSRLSLRIILTEFFCLFLFVFSATFTNAVFAFTLYFGIWHSLRSMVLEYKDIRHVVLNVASFIRALLPFTLLALTGMIVSYFILVQYFPEISPYMVFIVLISGLTLPHLIIMHEVYENADH